MTRHTTMVVGQTGGGKTVILNTIARSQTKLGKKTTLFTLNPKVWAHCCLQCCTKRTVRYVNNYPPY